MTHITEARVIGNHADMGPSTPAAAPAPRTVGAILRTGIRRSARRAELAAAKSTWVSEGGSTESGLPVTPLASRDGRAPGRVAR